MIYICSLQLGSHPVAVVQYTFTHKQYTERHKKHVFLVLITYAFSIV